MAVHECSGCGLVWKPKNDEVRYAYCPGCGSSLISFTIGQNLKLATAAPGVVDDYGPEWIRKAFKVELSEIGVDVARLLNDWVDGIYHIQRSASKVDWNNPHWIEINMYGSLATFDFNDLTRLVFLAHDYALRVEIDPRRNGIYKLLFHRRSREGNLYQRHPTIEQALSMWREYHAVVVE